MHEQLDSLQALLDCPTADALRLQSGQLLKRLGFENWIYTSGSNANRLPVWLNAYPADWMAHYRRQGYFEVDPVVEHCRHHTTPCLWAADPHAR
ncbi:MAG: autoinducer binding domain-containing protein, partial [Myxococcales bacterium]|nr:autoinducer binding domain-containing protein [Myxococcales bacterium]